MTKKNRYWKARAACEMETSDRELSLKERRALVLRWLVANAEMSQSQLARLLHVHINSARAYLQGETNLPMYWKKSFAVTLESPRGVAERGSDRED